MAVRSKEELLELVNTRIAGDTSDEAISLVEDISDTYDDLSSKVGSAEDWEKKYTALTEKYKERFYKGDDSKGIEEDIDEVEEDKTVEAPKTYDDLFKEVKEED